MNEPRRKLPTFRKGDVLTASTLQTLSSVLAESLTSPGDSVTPPADTAVILDEDLGAASNALTAPTRAKATVLLWDAKGGDNEDGGFVETDQQEDVWNHSESTEHERDTFGVARWIEGHWWFFGDCDPLSERSGNST